MIDFLAIVVSCSDCSIHSLADSRITLACVDAASLRPRRIPHAIAIPNQAIFQDKTGEWVLVGNGKSLEKRPVALGVRGPNRSEVVSGLAAGDEIALYPPEGWKP